MMVNSTVAVYYLSFAIYFCIIYKLTGRVIVDFVLYFVGMAMGVGRGRICLASFNSLNFRCHGNQGRS